MLLITFGGRCNRYFWDMPLKILRWPNFYMVFQLCWWKQKFEHQRNYTKRDHAATEKIIKSISGVKEESSESWYLWFLSFLPQWFMIPTKIFFQIHDSRRLLITYWLNNFLSGNVVSFYSFFGFQTSVFIQTRYNQSLCPGMEFFLEPKLSNRVTGETSGPNARIIWGGPGACSPGKIFENWTLGNATVLHSLDRTQLTHTYILLSFSNSLVIHDFRAEVQRFMIPKFLKQRFMILTFFVTDSWFMIPLPHSIFYAKPACTLNEEAYATVRQAVIDKLGDRRKKFIKELDI